MNRHPRNPYLPYMRLPLIFLILFHFGLSAGVAGQAMSPDTLIRQLALGDTVAVRRYLEQSGHAGTGVTRGAWESGFVRMVFCQWKRDTACSGDLRRQLLALQVPPAEARRIITTTFQAGVGFYTRPDVSLFLQETGVMLARQHGEIRAQFSFLQQAFSLHQMTGRTADMPAILRDMALLGRADPYLAFQTDRNYGLYYSALRQDSCAYYFDRYIAAAPQWIGRAHSNFLHAEAFAASKDSSIMASALMEYARHKTRQGDLREAGKLLVSANRMIPDTATFAILRVQVQLALSRLYADLVNPVQAIGYAVQAAALCDAGGMRRLRLTQVAAAKGYAHMAAGQYADAAAELETAFREYPRAVSEADRKKQALRLAMLAADLGDPVSAVAWRDSARLLTDQGDPENQFLERMADGALATQAGQPGKASTHFRQALRTSETARAPGWTKDALLRLYRAEKSDGRTADGLRSLEAYARLNDSLYRTGQDVALFDIEAGYKKSLQDETIARLNAEQSAARTSLAAQRRNFLIALAGLVALVTLLGGLWVLYRRVRSANAALSVAVAEKNILLREIHHRVKNNLQVISSLLRLQSGFIQDEAAQQAIAEGRSRVQTMALLHQNLYREENLTGVDMTLYLDQLIQGLFDAYNISPDRIRLHRSIAPITLDIDTVVPLGLIANELISNALKHAFPAAQPGNLYVDLYEQDDRLMLRVRDDGRGYDPGATSGGFGTKLIRTLGQKLDADISSTSGPGTEIIVSIRNFRKAA